MIKILRISSVAAVALAVFFIILLFFTGKNSEDEKILKTVDAVEKFNSAKNHAVKKDNQVSPLVKQAEAFALFLNPPQPEPTPEEIAQQIAAPVIVTPKFTLLGTSLFTKNPEKSRALIDEPGKGLHWVKQDTKVGYIEIKEIKDGAVIVGEGSKTSEIIAERPEKVSLLRNPPSESAAASPLNNIQAGTAAVVAESIPNPELDTKMEKLSAELFKLEQEVAAGKLDPNSASQKSSELMEKYVSEIEKVRTNVSTEESKNLNLLGSQLQAQQQAQTAIEKPKKPQIPNNSVNIAEKKPKDANQIKPIPRQRDPRRRGSRPVRTNPAAGQIKPSN